MEGELRECGQRNPEQGEGCQGYQDETTMTTSHPGDWRGAPEKDGGQQVFDFQALRAIVTILRIQAMESFNAIQYDAQNVLFPDEPDGLINRLPRCSVSPHHHEARIRPLSKVKSIGQGQHRRRIDQDPIEIAGEAL